jgi:hypothetical protein
MTVLIQLSDDPNILPIFGLVLSLCIANDISENPFVICNNFDEHLQSYNVSLTSKLISCSLNSLDCKTNLL